MFSEDPFHLFSGDISEEEFDVIIKTAIVDALAFKITDSKMVCFFLVLREERERTIHPR